jgi:hypothetical protein
MREELDKKLCEKYPKIFADRNGDMRSTAMCWGFECDDGWYNILDRLCSNIQWHIDSSVKSAEYNTKHNAMVTAAKAGDWTLFDEQFVGGTYTPAYLQMRKKDILESTLRNTTIVGQVVATQVKEKFGTLRFYYGGGDDVIHGMAGMAESMSGCTCEVCGNVGRQRGGGWIRTLCDEHAEKAGYAILKEEDYNDNDL